MSRAVPAASAGRSRRAGGAGARVLLHGRSAEALQVRAAELGNGAGTLAFDVTDAAAVRAAFARIAAEHGRLDILVNNAGIIPRKPMLETTDEDWQAVIDANLTAYFRLSREAARLMVPSRSGRIIMVSSIMGLLARPTIPGYVTAKAGLHGMTRALAVELAPHGITVNALAPGSSRPTRPRHCMRTRDSTNGSRAARRSAAGASRRNWRDRRCSWRPTPHPMSPATCWWWMEV